MAEVFNERVLNSKCIGWSDNQHYDVVTVRHIEQWANDKLTARGYLFLRDIYDQMDFHVDKQSCLTGRIYDDSRKDTVIIDISELHNGALLLKFNATSIIDRFD